MGIDQRRVDIQPICIQSNAENKSVNINIWETYSRLRPKLSAIIRFQIVRI
jgi:hypothetical protein